MLARLMRAVLASAVLLALGLLAWGVAAGESGWGLFGAVVVLSVHAWSQAIEFSWAAWARKPDDPGPRPRVGQWLRAWLGEVVAAPRVFFWQQPFRHAAQPDNLPAHPTGRRGVVLVHGFFCNRGFWNRWMARLRADGVHFVAVTLEPPFGGIPRYVETLDAAMRRVQQATGMPSVVVAHSMGGLVVRAWAASAGSGAVTGIIHRLITIGTPHQGTAVAALAFSANGRQMRRGSAWLQALVQTESDSHLPAATTAFFSSCDNIVFPPSLAQWPGAQMRHLDGQAHVEMADHGEPWAELQRWLAERPPDPRAG